LRKTPTVHLMCRLSKIGLQAPDCWSHRGNRIIVLMWTDAVLWGTALLAVGLANLGKHWSAIRARTSGDLILLAITSAELALLLGVTPTFTIADWIYVLQHVLVLGIALTRGRPELRDNSLGANCAVVIAYTYPYAQLLYLRWAPGYAGSATSALVLVTLAAALSLASLLTLGKRFGIRPALRGLANQGPYRVVRHPMYLAYLLSDIGYNLQEWNIGTLLLVMLGWLSLLYRVHAEERILSRHAGWRDYIAVVRYRLVPGLW
jgi:protein-S-isoprenylcysteine O-methyltransferase Ste14